MKLKTLAFAFAAAAAAALSGCAGSGTLGVDPVVSTRGTLIDERALVTAEAAYNVAASTYLAADGRSQIPAAVRPRARDALIRAYDALKAARSAYEIGDAATFATQAAAVTRFAGEARALLTQ